MATLQHNVTTVLTKNLIEVGEEINNIKYISIANIDSDSAIVNLFLNKGDNNYYLIKGRRITPGSTLFLNKDNNISFDNSNNGFSLRTQIQDDGGGAVSVDIIINE
tara:strand:- start:41 stop:358 length:318 start_codon:yes stop_codon:yes gene_type:complete